MKFLELDHKFQHGIRANLIKEWGVFLFSKRGKILSETLESKFFKFMAGSSISGEIRTPIFSGVNYDFWRTKLRTIFVSHDLWSLIEDGDIVPLSTVVLTET